MSDLPPRRPKTSQASFTRSAGGVIRPESRWNSASSSFSIGKANSALSTTRQVAQDAPPNHSGKASIKSRAVVEGLATSQLPWPDARVAPNRPGEHQREDSAGWRVRWLRAKKRDLGARQAMRFDGRDSYRHSEVATLHGSLNDSSATAECGATIVRDRVCHDGLRISRSTASVTGGNPSFRDYPPTEGSDGQVDQADEATERHAVVFIDVLLDRRSCVGVELLQPGLSRHLEIAGNVRHHVGAE
jgi:hypothetical protein